MDYDVAQRLREVARKLQAVRIGKGWSQQEAANLLGILRESLCYVENGKQRLTVELLLKMSFYYERTPADLLMSDMYGEVWEGEGCA